MDAAEGHSVTTAIAQVVRDKPGIQLIVFLRDADAQLIMNDCVRTCPFRSASRTAITFLSPNAF